MLGLFLLLQLFPAIVEGQSWTVTSDSITRREFLDILVVGERTDLSETGPAVAADKQVLISLYGVAREGSCVPETHYVCAFDYYLAVSDFGEYPRQGAFRIGRWGEIRAIQWLPRQTNDAYGTARLRLQVANYPKIVLQVTDRLQEEIRTIELLASPTGIVSLRNPP